MISGIVYFREIILESLQNSSKTSPWYWKSYPQMFQFHHCKHNISPAKHIYEMIPSWADLVNVDYQAAWIGSARNVC